MKKIRIEKITLNVGAGKNQDTLGKGVQLLKHITGVDPIKTTAKKRIPSWGLRPGLPIGCKITLRDSKWQKELLPRLIRSKDGKLTPSQFDGAGNISFGIHEYIDIPEVKYKPEIGIIGLQVCITLIRKGYRVKRKAYRSGPIGKKHKITKEEAMKFMQENFGVIVEEK